jgi:hypothetical protein
MYGVNIGCLEDVSEEELSNIPITYVDGLNDQVLAHRTYFFTYEAPNGPRP